MSKTGTRKYDPQIAIRGSGEAIVLVPGLDGTGELFYRQTPLLARVYRVATYALRDHAATMGTLIDDLATVVDRVAPSGGRAIILGESFGGALALSFALAHPKLVSALVILNSFPYFAPQVRLWVAIHGLGLLPWGAMQLSRRLTASRLHSAHTHRREVRKFIDLTANATRGGYIGRLKLLRRYDVRRLLHTLQPPTLFLASDRDRLVPSVAQARYMTERVPGARIQILEGHGHICLIAPDIDLAAILSHWRGQRTNVVWPGQKNQLADR